MVWAGWVLEGEYTWVRKGRQAYSNIIRSKFLGHFFYRSDRVLKLAEDSVSELDEGD